MKMVPKNTTVVLLAAGHGKRMLPLTENTPKPLLKVGKYSLIEHHLRRLANLGFTDIVINVAYLAEKIINTLGSGVRYGVNIRYSDESSCGALETAGGLRNALPLITSDPFITINADIWTDFNFADLLKGTPDFAKLIMVKSPNHNADGDFFLDADGRLTLPTLNCERRNSRALTYSGIAIYRQCIIRQLNEGKAALAPIFRQLINEGKLEGEQHQGVWLDIGTPERLKQLRDNWTSKEGLSDNEFH